MRRLLIHLPIVILATTDPTHAAIIRVPGDHATIASAFTAASAGDTVLVAPGTYSKSLLELPSDVSLVSEAGAEVTVIDGDEKGYLWNYGGGPDTKLVGFTFQGGYHGVYFKDSSVLLRDNIFHRTELNLWSGGPRVIGNVFSNSYLDLSGGGGPVAIEGNTFVTSDLVSIALHYLGPPVEIRNNIVVGGRWGIACVGAFPCESVVALECNDVWGQYESPYWGGLHDRTGVDANISEEPRFCDPAAGDFTLHALSPCAPGRHPHGEDCGLIGAMPVTCGDPTAVEAATWSFIKVRFR